MQRFYGSLLPIENQFIVALNPPRKAKKHGGGKDAPEIEKTKTLAGWLEEEKDRKPAAASSSSSVIDIPLCNLQGRGKNRTEQHS